MKPQATCTPGWGEGGVVFRLRGEQPAILQAFDHIPHGVAGAAGVAREGTAEKHSGSRVLRGSCLEPVRAVLCYRGHRIEANPTRNRESPVKFNVGIVQEFCFESIVRISVFPNSNVAVRMRFNVVLAVTVSFHRDDAIRRRILQI